MYQLGGLDTLFLNLETNAVPMHVGSLTILNPKSDRADLSFRGIRGIVEARLHLLPMFRRRLLTTPLNLDQPYWIEDPDFDIERHVRHRVLPAPGGDRELAELVSDVMATRLDRERPLWKLYYIEGLKGGRVALLTKLHHACVDGVSGAELLTHLLDVEATPRRIEPPETPWIPDEFPPPWRVAWVTARHLLARPGEMLRLLRETTPIAMTIGRTALAQRRARQAARPEQAHDGNAAPRTRFNCTITSRRSYAFRSLSLADVKMVKNAYGVSVNDVILCLCAQALREYLAELGELPDSALIAGVPMSVRSDAERGSGGNRVTMARTSLFTDIADPVERLGALHRRMGDVKSGMKAIPASLMLDWAHAPPPAVMTQAARLYENYGVQDHMSPPFNVVISNVPGPSRPLYLNGAEVEASFPVSIPYHGLACNITVFSYRDSLDVGITAHRPTVPDPERLIDGMRRALASLKRRARRGQQAPPPAAAKSARARKRRA